MALRMQELHHFTPFFPQKISRGACPRTPLEGRDCVVQSDLLLLILLGLARMYLFEMYTVKNKYVAAWENPSYSENFYYVQF